MLALSNLANELPGNEPYFREIAARLDGVELYEECRDLREKIMLSVVQEKLGSGLSI